MSGFLKTSIIIIDADNFEANQGDKAGHAALTSCLIYAPSSDTVTEEFWSPGDVYEYRTST